MNQFAGNVIIQLDRNVLKQLLSTHRRNKASVFEANCPPNPQKKKKKKCNRQIVLTTWVTRKVTWRVKNIYIFVIGTSAFFQILSTNL